MSQGNPRLWFDGLTWHEPRSKLPINHSEYLPRDKRCHVLPDAMVRTDPKWNIGVTSPHCALIR